MLEQALEQRFHLAVRKLGGDTFKLPATHAAGIPDRLVLLPGGRMYLVELKTRRGVLRPIQRVWHARAKELGTQVIVLRGEAEVDAWLASV